MDNTDSAAQLIQVHYRTWRCVRVLRQQRSARINVLRSEEPDGERIETAVGVVQARFRLKKAKEGLLSQAELTRSTEAAVMLQSAAKQLMAKRFLEAVRSAQRQAREKTLQGERDNSARSIQLLWKMIIMREYIHTVRRQLDESAAEAENNYAATMVQRAARSSIALAELKRKKHDDTTAAAAQELEHGAVMVQSALRRYHAIADVQSLRGQLKESVGTVEADARNLERNYGARIVQAQVRRLLTSAESHIQRRRAQHTDDADRAEECAMALERAFGVGYVQRLVRRSRAIKNVIEQRMKLDDEAELREHMATVQETEAGAAMVQASYRGHKGRDVVRNKRCEAFQRTATELEPLAVEQERGQGAMMVQTQVRRAQSAAVYRRLNSTRQSDRCHEEEVAAEDEAKVGAELVQSQARRLCARSTVRSKVVSRQHALAELESAASHLEDEYGAKLVQSQARRLLAQHTLHRRVANDLEDRDKANGDAIKQELGAASTMIQSGIRQNLARAASVAAGQRRRERQNEGFERSVIQEKDVGATLVQKQIRRLAASADVKSLTDHRLNKRESEAAKSADLESAFAASMAQRGVRMHHSLGLVRTLRLSNATHQAQDELAAREQEKQHGAIRVQSCARGLKASAFVRGLKVEETLRRDDEVSAAEDDEADVGATMVQRQVRRLQGQVEGGRRSQMRLDERALEESESVVSEGSFSATKIQTRYRMHRDEDVVDGMLAEQNSSWESIEKEERQQHAANVIQVAFLAQKARRELGDKHRVRTEHVHQLRLEQVASFLTRKLQWFVSCDAVCLRNHRRVRRAVDPTARYTAYVAQNMIERCHQRRHTAALKAQREQWILEKRKEMKARMDITTPKYRSFDELDLVEGKRRSWLLQDEEEQRVAVDEAYDNLLLAIDVLYLVRPILRKEKIARMDVQRLEADDWIDLSRSHQQHLAHTKTREEQWRTQHLAMHVGTPSRRCLSDELFEREVVYSRNSLNREVTRLVEECAAWDESDVDVRMRFLTALDTVNHCESDLRRTIAQYERRCRMEVTANMVAGLRSSSNSFFSSNSSVGFLSGSSLMVDLSRDGLTKT
eukprot:PhM_4_TR15959/c0_g1_i1/m.102772